MTSSLPFFSRLGLFGGVINDEHKLAELMSALQTAEWIAVDTEADSLHAYPEKLCLMQISTAGRDELIDPLAGFALDPLWPVLARHELIFHGADYDLRLMRRGFGFVPERVFDTMLAARLLGHREFGLSHLVSKILGIKLEKGPQKMDWARRPLTDRMVSYARNDTRYLRPVAEVLREELRVKGRLAWHAESCARTVENAAVAPPPNPDTVWRIKGSDRLAPKALGILREVWRWRESVAMETGKPPYFVLSHESVVAVAARAAHGEAFEKLLPLRFSTKRRAGVVEAVGRGLSLPPEEWPGLRQYRGVRLTRAQQHRCEELRKIRDRHAAELEIDPTLIASRSDLVELASDLVKGRANLMRWQKELLEK